MIYSFIFWGIWLLLILLVLPISPLMKIGLDEGTKSCRLIYCCGCIIAILVCVVPMSWNPAWNGEWTPYHHAQYEHMAEALRARHLNLLDYEVKQELIDLGDDVYEPGIRDSVTLGYGFDEAFYNGKYYMYFGVIPVILVFLPYLMVTGQSLNTYHATQLFTAVFVVAFFVLLWQLAKKYFPKIKVGSIVFLAMALSFVSIGFCVSEPALYCTATSSALCMECLSLLFFFEAVFVKKEQNVQICFATLGALFGAMTFGCRPSLAIANLLVIPMLIVYLRKQATIDAKLIIKLVVAASPYFVIGALLMIYNYLRFGNPFEFGVTYMLTDCNLFLYKSDITKFYPINVISKMKAYLVSREKTDGFPYIGYSGAFINYPFLICILLTILKPIRKSMKNSKTWGMFWATIIMMLFMVFVDSFATVAVWEEYRLDFYYLICLALVLVIGGLINSFKNEKITNSFIGLFAVITCFNAFLMYMVPRNSHMTQIDPAFREFVANMVLWK